MSKHVLSLQKGVPAEHLGSEPHASTLRCPENENPANKGRFAAKTGHGEARRVPDEILGEAKRNFDALGLHRRVPVDSAGRCLCLDAIFLGTILLVRYVAIALTIHRDRHVDAHPA